MIKCKLVRSYARLGHELYIYKEGPNGEVYLAKPVTLDFDTIDSQYLNMQPTLYLPERSGLDLDPSLNSETKNMLTQKERDMERHIKSLEVIIDKLVNK